VHDLDRGKQTHRISAMKVRKHKALGRRREKLGFPLAENDNIYCLYLIILPRSIHDIIIQLLYTIQLTIIKLKGVDVNKWKKKIQAGRKVE
jgi:hypothetical protein